MNDCVPDFGVEQDDPLFPVFGSDDPRIRPKTDGDELAEILWKKGPVLRRFTPPPPPPPPPVMYQWPGELFMGEDELAEWLLLPVEDREEVESRPPPAVLPLPLSQASTVVDSNKTAPSERMTMPPCSVACKNCASGSSLGDGDGRKRKAEHSERHSDDEAAGHGSIEENKRRSTRRSTRRARAAEVHNLSERKRRDRINEKMKALQQLIPRCNKTDKASMLDDAVEYLKSLQLQIQMISMACAVPPMVFPGVAPMGMFMGIGIESGASRVACPMMQFPHAPVAGMPMQAFRPPPSQAVVDGRPPESLPAHAMNKASPFFPCFASQQRMPPPPQQDHAGTSKSTVETGKPARSS